MLNTPEFIQVLSTEALDELNRCRKDLRFKKSEVLFQEGSPAIALYLILSGHTKLYKTGFDGKQQILRIAGPGNVLGYRSLLQEATYHVSASCLEDSEICCLEAKAVTSLCVKHPEMGFALLKGSIQDLVAAEELATRIALRPVRERMANFLLMLKESYGHPCEEGLAIELTLSREEIGEAIGVTRETATRLLSQFRKEGLVAMRDYGMLILRPDILTRMAKLVP